ncbi:hypothetical protein M405DRAFT_814608 [Rhizopogon salebrosus TDB-379]|nr:hypothetical protein M405DRAFT_814608 [Rhizopogon salebrosus TDB-379]
MGHKDAGSIDSIPNQVQSAITHSAKWPFSALSQTIQLGIGDTLHFVSTIEQDLEKTLALVQVAGEYIASQTQAAVEEAVNEVLHQDDQEDDLSKMIIDIILKNCMSKVRGVRK